MKKCSNCKYLYYTEQKPPHLMCVRPLDSEEDNWTPILVERTSTDGCGIDARFHAHKEEAQDA